VNKAKEYISSVYKEIGAISWPSTKRVYNDTIIVLVALVLSAAVIGLLDFVFSEAFKRLIDKISA
jgi:preprotein translocase SecE subunit